MTKQLIITFPPETTEKYLQVCQRQVTGEVEEDVVPCGVQFTVLVDPIFQEHEVYMHNKCLGAVNVNLTDCDE